MNPEIIDVRVARLEERFGALVKETEKQNALLEKILTQQDEFTTFLARWKLLGFVIFLLGSAIGALITYLLPVLPLFRR